MSPSLNLLQRVALLAAFGLLVTASQPVQAQTPLPQPSLPLISMGEVGLAARTPDGGAIIAGFFSMVGGQPRAGLARVKADGTLDPDWKATLDGDSATAICAADDGSVYLGGDFTSVNGQPRGKLARLIGGDAALDPSWNPGADGTVLTLACATDGSIYVGGAFQTIGSQPRSRLAKLNSAGAVDPTWNPAPDQIVSSLAVDSDGTVFVAGEFSNIGGQARSRLAKLAATNTGSADALWNPGADDRASVLLLGGNGSLFVAGNFVGNVGGQARIRMAKLSTTGTGAADPTWAPAPDGEVYALAQDGAGNLFVGGIFTNIGGQVRRGLAKLSSTGAGAADPNWDYSLTSAFALVMGTGGKLIVGGRFDVIGAETRSSLAIIDAVGTVLPAVDVENPAQVFAVAAQSDGSVIVGGDFVRAGSERRSRLLRLQPDGSLDATWHPAANASVRAVAIDSNDNVFVGGAFSRLDGQPHQRIAKLSGSGAGAVDAAWNAGSITDNTVVALALGDNNDLFVGGAFSTIGGQTQGYLAKLSATGAGAVDASWKPVLDRTVRALAVDHDNNALYVGGNISIDNLRQPIVKIALAGSGTFDTTWDSYLIGPTFSPTGYAVALGENHDVFAGGNFQFSGSPLGTHRNIARMPASGGNYYLWNPNADGVVYSMATSSTAGIFAGGFFSNIGGQPRSRLAKLSLDNGAADPNWNPGVDGVVWALSTTSNGRLYVVGNFSTAGGVPRGSIAAFDVDKVFANGFE